MIFKLDSIYKTSLLIILNSMFATNIFTLELNNEYIINNENIYANDIFPEIPKNKNFLIAKFPNGNNKLFMSINLLIDTFEKNGFIIENSNLSKSIKFIYIQKNSCIKCVINSLKKEFEKKYPEMNIKNIQIFPKNDNINIPNNYNLIINDSDLQKSKGLFYIKDTNGNKSYFKFSIDGYLEILKSSINIQRGEFITSSNTIHSTIKFDRYRGDYISASKLNNVVAKGYIPKDREILDRNIEKNHVISKGQMVKGFINDDHIYIETEVKALQNGGIDDSIQVETLEGIRLKAIVINGSFVKII